jgi:hypothetical protein
MKIKDWVATNGGFRKASKKIPCHWLSLFNWTHGKRKPIGIFRPRLEKLGIEWE